jgi:archaemetzincin
MGFQNSKFKIQNSTAANSGSQLKGKPTQKMANSACLPFAERFRLPSVQDAQRAACACTESAPPAPYDRAKPPHAGLVPHPTSDLDWLHLHAEPGQTFSDYVVNRMPPLPESFEVCLQPVNLDVPSSFVQALVRFASVYLGTPVTLLPPLDFDLEHLEEAEGGVPTEHENFFYATLKAESDVAVSTSKPVAKKRRRKKTQRGKAAAAAAAARPKACLRVNPRNGYRQFQLDDVRTAVQTRQQSGQDRLVLVLTSVDLFSGDSDLFLAGLADYSSCMAVFSIKRYDPLLEFGEDYWHEVGASTWRTQFCAEKKGGKRGEKGSPNENNAKEAEETKKVKETVVEEEELPAPARAARLKVMLRRACRLFVHEALHLLQFKHCIYHPCCMNGSGHLAEDDRQPLTLCPVDTRKLCEVMRPVRHLEPVAYEADVARVIDELEIGEMTTSS